MTQRKRNLFAELEQGIQEINAHQAGKITLHTHAVKKPPTIVKPTKKKSK